jgi:hypothetical protein
LEINKRLWLAQTLKTKKGSLYESTVEHPELTVCQLGTNLDTLAQQPEGQRILSASNVEPRWRLSFGIIWSIRRENNCNVTGGMIDEVFKPTVSQMRSGLFVYDKVQRYKVIRCLLPLSKNKPLSEQKKCC